MAAYNRYQYETSPRKLEPEYRPTRKKYPKKSTARKVQDKKVVSKKQEEKKIKEKNIKIRLVLYVIVLFVVLFAISYRNSMIAEEFGDIKSLKAELASIEKENEQLKANIESSLNLNNIEKSANENLGMTKLDNSRTVYINTPKQDYVQSGAEEVVKSENNSWIEKINSWINSLIK